MIVRRRATRRIQAATKIARFWTLAVEEQFYLFWPWLILFIPRRLILPLMLLAIAAGPIYRYAALALGFTGPACEVAPFACLDTLAAGSLLALIVHCRGAANPLPTTLCTILGWLGFAGMVAFEITKLLGWHRGGGWVFTARDSVLAIMAVGIIARAVNGHGFRGPAGRLLEFRPLVYLGTISYGVYVYHLIVGAVTTRLFRHWQITLSPTWAGWIDITLTLLVAALSWHLFEKPLNDLKRFFPYRWSR